MSRRLATPVASVYEISDGRTSTRCPSGRSLTPLWPRALEHKILEKLSTLSRGCRRSWRKEETARSRRRWFVKGDCCYEQTAAKIGERLQSPARWLTSLKFERYVLWNLPWFARNFGLELRDALFLFGDLCFEAWLLFT